MRNTYVLITFCLFVFHPNLMSQTKMTAASNMPRSNDKVSKRQMEYFEPGRDGPEQTWDFRYMKVLDERHETKYYCGSDSALLYGEESDVAKKYLFRNDSLQTIGSESRLRTMTYQHPLTILSFPCSYGDTSKEEYHGTGSYCDKYVLETNGTLESKIDASGIILLNDEDTLHHVLRLHQVYAADIAQYLPEDTLNEIERTKRRIEDRYQWYAYGYRYPVFETVCVTILHNLMPVTSQKYAYCFLPSDQLQLEDSINRRILEEDSLYRVQRESPPVIHYSIAKEGHHVNIDYSLNEDATINAIVCDRMGLVYRSASAHGQAGTNGTLQLDANGLKPGIYVIYLNVNGQVFSEKIQISSSSLL